MNVLHKYTIETLKKNKTRTIVTILGIALSMMLFTAVIEGAFSGKSYLEECIINLEGPYHGIAKNLTILIKMVCINC
jgi:putative ABC transport system permease protein